MSYRFPANNETMMCPHCHAKCQFSHGQGAEVGNDQRTVVRTAFCVSCRGAVVEVARLVRDMAPGIWNVRPGSSPQVYPTAPTRPPAPAEVRDANAELADDYDEAAACEPHSLQAAVFLLGRCAEEVLIDKAHADRKQTLGPMIDGAIKAGHIPDHLLEPLKVGFALARRQAAHVWVDEKGNPLTVDAATTDSSFAVVDMLFLHFYVTVVKMAALNAQMISTEANKKDGDAT